MSLCSHRHIIPVTLAVVAQCISVIFLYRLLFIHVSIQILTILDRDDDFETFDKDFFFQQQMAEESRIERERQDAALARSIQDEPEAFAAMNAPASSTPSAFDRLSGVFPQPSSSSTPPPSQTPSGPPSFARRLPWAKVLSANVSNRGNSQAPSSSRDSFVNTPRLKTEPSTFRSMPGSFNDDSSTASDSEIEIIEPSAFRDNGRHNQTRTESPASVHGTRLLKAERPSFSPGAQAAGNAALRRFDQTATNSALQKAMYGNQPAHPWMTQTVGPWSKKSPPGAGDNVYPSASLGNGPNAVPGAYGGGIGGFSSSGNWHDMGPGMSSGRLPNNPAVISTGYPYGQAGPSQTFGAGPRSFVTDPLMGVYQGTNTYDELTRSLSNPYHEPDLDHYTMNDPHKTAQELKELLENIRPDDEPQPEDREPTPEGLKESLVSDLSLLYAHQC